MRSSHRKFVKIPPALSPEGLPLFGLLTQFKHSRLTGDKHWRNRGRDLRPSLRCAHPDDTVHKAVPTQDTGRYRRAATSVAMQSQLVIAGQVWSITGHQHEGGRTPSSQIEVVAGHSSPPKSCSYYVRSPTRSEAVVRHHHRGRHSCSPAQRRPYSSTEVGAVVLQHIPQRVSFMYGDAVVVAWRRSAVTWKQVSLSHEPQGTTTIR